MSGNTDTGPFFGREKSGYVRDLRTFDVFVFNVLGLALGLALSTNPSFIGGFAPSSSLVLVVVLGAALAVVNGLTYGWFGAIMPSTGGDYIFVSRGLSHRLGFLTSWGFTACQIYGLSINVGWILSVAIGPALLSLGVSLSNPGLISLGHSISQPHFVAIGSVVLIVLYFLLAYSGAAFKPLVIYPLFAIALLGPILMIWTLFSHSQTEFSTSFNSFVSALGGPANAYDVATSTAKGAGVTIDPALKWQASFQAVPLGFLCFIGFTYSVYVGGEILKPKRAQVAGILGALAFAFVVFVVGMWKYVQVVGQEFHSAIGFPPVLSALSLPGNSMNLIAGILSPSPAYNVIMQIGILLWFLLVPYVMLEVCTHNFVAWTCERLMPKKLNLRSSLTHTPWVASMTVCAVATLCVGANYYFGFSLVGAAALAAGAFLFTGIAAYNLPRKYPDAFALAPRSARTEFLGMSAFQIAGILSAAGFLWIIYAAVKYPEISGGTSTHTVVMLSIVYISGLLVYEIARSKLERLQQATGVDLDALFQEIPQD